VTVAAVVVALEAAHALADASGRPAARRIVDSAWAGGALPIVVVSNDPDEEVRAALAGTPAILIEPPSDGETTAYHRGAEAAVKAVDETDAILIWPAAMTWVDPETVTSLIEAHGRQPTAPMRPLYGGAAGWPVLVPVDPAGAMLLEALDPLDEALRARAADVVGWELGDPGSVVGRDVPLAGLPPYEGPSEPVGGPPPDWGAAAADEPD